MTPSALTETVPGLGERRQRRQAALEEGVLEDREVRSRPVDDHVVAELDDDLAAEAERERVEASRERAAATTADRGRSPAGRPLTAAAGPDLPRHDGVDVRIGPHDAGGQGESEDERQTAQPHGRNPIEKGGRPTFSGPCSTALSVVVSKSRMPGSGSP